MGRRARIISDSILSAIFQPPDHQQKRSIFTRILEIFALFRLHLARYRLELFKKLRVDTWMIDEDEYRESFRKAEKKSGLVPIGDLGYSGSVGHSNQSFKRFEFVQD
jgi:hypothetical protein